MQRQTQKQCNFKSFTKLQQNTKLQAGQLQWIKHKTISLRITTTAKNNLIQNMIKQWLGWGTFPWWQPVEPTLVSVWWIVLRWEWSSNKKSLFCVINPSNGVNCPPELPKLFEIKNWTQRFNTNLSDRFFKNLFVCTNANQSW